MKWFGGAVILSAGVALSAASCGNGNGTTGGTGGAGAGGAVPPLTQEELKDPQQCQKCHPTHYKEWSGSMHAYAAEDPVFLAMNARGQRETKGALGTFCLDCHAPLAVRAGATKDGLDLDKVDKKLKGVTCYFCHSVTEVTGAHNNPPPPPPPPPAPLPLPPDPPPLPPAPVGKAPDIATTPVAGRGIPVPIYKLS